MTRVRERALGGEGWGEELGEQGRGAGWAGDVEGERAITEREADAELEEGAALVLAPDDGVDLAHPLGSRREAKANAARQRCALYGVIGETEQEGVALLAQVSGGEGAGDGQRCRHGALGCQTNTRSGIIDPDSKPAVRDDAALTRSRHCIV